jgi:serine/threonine-protein kinase HipA
MEELALQVIKSQISVTGVQAKISLDLVPGENPNVMKRFTIVGLWGGYILKPPSPNYPQLPEVEDLTMHLADITGIKTVPHSLIRFQSGELAYITKRIDRVKKKKVPMEDMCQLTERLTEDKYHGSYEQIAKAIQKYSSHPGLDLVNFFEQVLFSFLTGNADMHLKNFSLIHHPVTGYLLSPSYDLVSTALVNPADDEDLALTLNGKKRKIKLSDFTVAFNNSSLTKKQQENIFSKMQQAKKSWFDMIAISFLSDDLKKEFKKIIVENFSRLNKNN